MPVPTSSRFCGAIASLMVILEFFTITISIIYSTKNNTDVTPKWIIALLLINSIAAAFAFIGAIQLNKYMLLPFFFCIAILICVHIFAYVVNYRGSDPWMDNAHLAIIMFNIFMTSGVGVLYRHIIQAEKVSFLAAYLYAQRHYHTI